MLAIHKHSLVGIISQNQSQVNTTSTYTLSSLMGYLSPLQEKRRQTLLSVCKNVSATKTTDAIAPVSRNPAGQGFNLI